MTLRGWSRLGIAAAGLLISTLANAQILSSKRGFADTGANYSNLQAANAGWYYTWGTGPANPGNFDANFYPMFWNGPSQSTIDGALARNPLYLLGFNEPERSDQANMTVAQAITSWTTISSSTIAYNSAHGTSIKLVSPAVADTGGSTGGQAWLASFMSQASASGLKVDAVAFHWYDISDPSNPSGAASQFLSRVDSYHNSYGLPVFITEFAIHDWGGVYTDAQIIEANRQFLNIVVPGLESRSYVAGYTWYNWFSDSPLYTSSNGILTPTQMGWSYIGAVGSGATADLGGKDLGQHVADLTGGTLTMTSAGTVRYIDALANTSAITGTVNWGLNVSSNWVRIQPGAALQKIGTNQITFSAGTIANDGTLALSDGVLQLGVGMAGVGALNILSNGGAIGSTGRFELTGNISIPNPITFAQRNDPGGSDGIRNVSGSNTLGGPVTITVGGNQTRVRSDAGLLTLAGPISTNATSARNLYLQGAGDGVVGGAISDNAANASGQINLTKEGAGTWTLLGANTYTGTTTISAGTLRLGQLSASSIASAAVANYSFDNVSGGTVINSGTGGASMNGTLTGGATIVPGGQSGNALSVSGGSYLNINSPIVNLGNTGNWTVSAWVKTTIPGASILSKSNGGWANGNTIFYLGDGTGPGSGGVPSGVRWAGGFFQGSTAAASVIDNNWHQVTYVNNSGSFAVYVDGIPQTLSSYNSSFGNADVGSIVRLGFTTDTVASDGTVNFSGLLDSVQFYSQALSATQVAAVYQGGSTGLLPSATSVSIAAGATLDLNGTAQTVASLSGAPGSSVLLGNGALTVNGSVSTTFSGFISGAGSLIKAGSATFSLQGPNTYTGNTTISAGTLEFGGGVTHNLPGTIQGAGALVVDAGTTLQSGLPQLASSTINGTHIINANASLSNRTGQIGTLVLAGAAPASWSGLLDLTNNNLIVGSAANTTSFANIQSQIIQAAGVPAPANPWNGTGGITSSAAAAASGSATQTALGYATGAEYTALTGATLFDSLPFNPTDTLIKYTLVGDANLDGTVNINDFFALSGHITLPGDWSQGDFNYTGTVDINDFFVMTGNFGKTLAAGNLVSAAGQTAPVPEPGSLVILSLTAALLCRRRRAP